MSPNIFISYSYNDFDFINKIYKSLTETKTISIWNDNLEIRTGDIVQNSIEKAIKECDCCLFYLSESALNSKWVKKEHSFALQYSKTIYYILDKEDTRKILRKWKILQGQILRIPIINDVNFWTPLLELISTILSKHYINLYPNIDINSLLDSADKKGISRIQQGRFTKSDDDCLNDLIENSETIKIMMLNAYNFFDRFKEPIEKFLRKENSKLFLLLADEKSEFYNENSIMINPAFKNNEQNQALIGLAISRAKNLFTTASPMRVFSIAKYLLIRKYNTQFRLPMIIFDDKYVHLTLNLPPNESIDGMTIEINNRTNQSYVFACIKHFETVWNLSKTVPIDIV